MSDNICSYKSMHTLMVDPFMFVLHCFNKIDQSKSINNFNFQYDFQVYPASKTYLYNSYADYENLNLVNSTTIDLLPMAVRYADVKNKIYVIERPPFQIDIDFYPNKKVHARLASHIPNKKMWIPWTVFVVSLGDSPSQLKASLYFNDRPLDSLDDLVIVGYTPNLFSDAKVCFGNSQYTFAQRIDKGDIEYNVSTVYNYLFNDYFTQWNPDISSNLYHYLFDYFSKNGFIAKALAFKKYPKGIENLSYWNTGHPFKGWIYILFLLSVMNYEETMDLVSFFKNHTFPTGYKRSITVSNIIKAYNIDSKITFNFEKDLNELNCHIANPYSYYLHAFRNAINPANRYKKLDLHVSVLFKDFPEDTDKSLINSENTYAYIYSHIFDKLNKVISSMPDACSLEEIFFYLSETSYNQFYNNLIQEFSWGNTHIVIDYFDYTNFINQSLEGTHV